MAKQLWVQSLGVSQVDGPALTAAAAASMLPTHMKGLVLPNGFFDAPGKAVRITAYGRISCVVTTPGTARFDVRLNSIVVFDSLAMNLNTTAQVNVPWWLDVLLTCRSVGNGTSATLMGGGCWSSPACVGSPAPTAGGSGCFLLPYNSVPVVGAGFDSTIANPFDMFFTQTVATGSMTLHELLVEDVS